MLTLPSAAEPLFMSFSIAFTEPTFQRIISLTIGGILATGRRTVTALYRVMRPAIRGHVSTYHRVFSRAVWSLWPGINSLPRPSIGTAVPIAGSNLPVALVSW